MIKQEQSSTTSSMKKEDQDQDQDEEEKHEQHRRTTDGFLLSLSVCLSPFFSRTNSTRYFLTRRFHPKHEG